MSTDLHVATWGQGGPEIVLVHGSFGWGEDTFAAQRPLADRFRLRLPDRRGFGQSPDTPRVDFERDAGDIAELLGQGAHLVGHSYGGVVALLAAALRPQAVHSLTVIEPPAFGLARGNPFVEEVVARTGALWANPPAETHAFLAGFRHALGFEGAVVPPLSGIEERSARASMTERLPWEAHPPLEALRAAGLPALVVSGGWQDTPPGARDRTGPAFAAVCDVIATALAAERVAIPGGAHNPQRLGEPFNTILAGFLDRHPPGSGAPR